MADDAGALLVRSGLVSTNALEEARSRVTEGGGTIGEQLVVSGAISDDALTDFYRSRLLVPQVNPNTLARLPIRVIATMSAEMAIELRAVPVALDAENNLTVAMSDPSDRHAVDEIAFFTGAYVVRAVATQMQIAWCLAHYYGHVTALGARLLQQTGEPEPARAPSPAASAPLPRAKGLTGKVEAMRHRAIAPLTGPINVARPSASIGDALAAAAAASLAPAPAAASPESPPMIDPEADATPRLGTQRATSSDGVPDGPQPRARSISGEIRVPVRRAPSIRPPVEPAFEDESGPVIIVEAMEPDEDTTGPRKVPPRRRNVKSDPPELAARAGEVDIATDRERSVDEGPGIIIDDDLLAPPPPPPSVEVSSTIEINDDTSAGVVIHERPPAEDASVPILLEQRRPADEEEPDEEVVVLDAKKPRTRSEKVTRVGIGALPALTRMHRDTEASPVVDESAYTPDPSADEDTTSVDTPAAPEADDATDPTSPVRVRALTDDGLAEPPPPRSNDRVATPAIQMSRITIDDDEDDDLDDDDPARATAVMSAMELDALIPHRSSEVVPAHLARAPQARLVEHDPLDDGWGPPGTTIPPPLLGAIPGADEDDARPGSIPVPDLDDAPLIVAPPSPPEIARGTPTAVPQTPVRALEDSTTKLLELIRALERAEQRDDVVDLMIDHLAESHRRAGFFVVKPLPQKGVTELTVFSIEPRPATLPFATLRLDRPSTLQDVVGTRLPYRGPMHDDASRAFLAAALGVCPPEILLVPVAVRERVVGVLFGEHRLKHTFDDQLALASRAAGQSLERILKSKRG